MNEAQRQFAMGVAGVRLWYARTPLPGAAPSPSYDFGELDPPPQQEPEQNPVVSVAAARRPASDASRQGLARLQGMLADAAPEQKKPAPVTVVSDSGPAQTPHVPRPAAPLDAGASREGGADKPDEAMGAEAGALAGQSIGFHWRFWVGEQWLIVSTCPDVASRGLEDNLAGNILHALGDSVRRTEALRWPVFSNPAVPGNDAAGAIDVVSAMATELDARRQLWLGLEPGEGESASGPVWREVRASLGEATVSFPRSLVALSSDPSGKRALWQMLREAGLS